MHLSRLIPDPRNHLARRDLANAYEMHRTLVRGVSPPEGSDLGVDPDPKSPTLERLLWRQELLRDGVAQVIIQTQTPPDWSFLPQAYLDRPAESKPVHLDFHNGQALRFRLCANPTVKRNNRRHALYDPAERLSWIQRKAGLGGFSIRRISFTSEQRLHARKNGHVLTLFAATFEGTLTVTDREALLKTIHSGVGPAKGLGMGLLSVAPI